MPQESNGRDTATLQAVAVEAGVATSTVSRFVKGELQLAEGTERRVIQAMETLGYRRPRPARPAAAPTDVRTIAVLVPELDSYYSRFSRLAVEAAEQVGLIPLVVSVGLTSLQAATYLRKLLAGGLEGVISIGTLRSEEARRLLSEHGVPLIAIDEPGGGGSIAPTHCIRVDNYSGARQVITFLSRLGHRDIAFISGPREHAAVADRRRGYEDGMVAAGLDHTKQFDLEGVCSEDFGFAALTSLLAFPGPRPTAVYVAADEIAAGVVNAAKHFRLTVPEELSIVGHDDIPIARRTVPGLTTVHTPLDAVADAAVSALFELVAGDAVPEGASTSVIPVTLTVRGSTAAPAT